MDFLKLVKSRRSCRNYQSRPVEREIIERCLEAARMSPSACNSQPWYFIVVKEKALKDDLARKAFSGIHKMNAFAKDAPVLVVAVSDKSKYVAHLGGQARGTQYNLIDLGIACQQFILGAQAEGLGSCWLGWFNERAVKKVLKLKRTKKVNIIISLGYPKKELLLPVKRKPLTKVSEFR
tara:strand:- start:372 stop:908 length:537 start_codon:yes stop_codon:yes gene_type:complete